MFVQRARRWQGLVLGLPVLLIVSTLSLYACTTTNGDAASGMPTLASPSTSTPAPLWQTATARVEAARASAQPVLRPLDAASPTPLPAASPSTLTNGPAHSTDPALASSANASPLSSNAAIPSGSQLLDRQFFSPALGREMPYFIYLPVGYAESGKRYPVLYMLHGYGGSNTEWIGYGLPETADRMINAGQIPPMIIVLPQGDQAYWVNHADDGVRWGDYTAQDVVREIDANYRTIPDGPHRAVGGLSMGAHGAMQLAMNYPSTFGVVGMHSPTLHDFDTALPFFGDEAFFDAHDPTHLVQEHPDQARQLKILVDVGEQDTEWHDRTAAFHDLLTALSIPHVWQTWPGSHDAAYWGGHCPDYLRFYAAALSG